MVTHRRRRSWGVLALLCALAAGALMWWRDAEPPRAVARDAPARRPHTPPRGVEGPRRAPPSAPRPVQEPAEDSAAAEALGESVVRCRVEVTLLRAVSAVVVGGREVPFSVDGDELVLQDMPPAGSFTLWASGARPIYGDWAETSGPGRSRCVQEPLSAPPSGRVRVVVENADQWPSAVMVVRVCGEAARLGRAGAVERIVPVGGCDVFAQRRDGLFFASSEVVTLEVEAGGEYELSLWLPEYRQGGVGMGIVAHEEGVLIERVLDGGAAAEAGLAPGDVVLEVDGVPAAALTLEEFVQVTTGEAGTEVTLIVSRGEGSDREELVYLLDRRVME